MCLHINVCVTRSNKVYIEDVKTLISTLGLVELTCFQIQFQFRHMSSLTNRLPFRLHSSRWSVECAALFFYSSLDASRYLKRSYVRLSSFPEQSVIDW